MCNFAKGGEEIEHEKHAKKLMIIAKFRRFEIVNFDNDVLNCLFYHFFSLAENMIQPWAWHLHVTANGFSCFHLIRYSHNFSATLLIFAA